MERLRVGLIGLGTAAQVMHLPYLRELDDRYEITALCDLSPGLVAALADDYAVPGRFTDWQQLLAEAPLEAVLVLTNGSHAPPAIAAARAGKHVLVEKPMCFTIREADEMTAAAEQAGVTLMVGYMKRYDPAYLHAQRLMPAVRERITYVRINTLHPPSPLYFKHHKIRRFDDVPAAVLEPIKAETQALIDEALGQPHHPWLDRAYDEFILGSMCHDTNALRGLFGEPEAVLSTDLWDDGGCIATQLRFPRGARCQFAWTFLRDLRHYDESISFFGHGARLHLQFPSPFLRSAPTLIVSEGMDGDVAWERTDTVSYEEAFKEELIHFHACVTRGHPPRTDAEDGKRDVALLRDLTLAWQSAREAPP